MKIINKDGKLFGKISIIDAIIILAVLCLVVLVGIKFSMNKNIINITKYDVETTYKIKDIKEFHKKSIKVGDKLYVRGSSDPVGEIIEVSAVNAVKTKSNAIGETIEYQSKDSYDVTIKVLQKTVKDKKSGYIAGKDQKLQVGTDYILDTPYTSIRATALDIQTKK